MNIAKWTTLAFAVVCVAPNQTLADKYADAYNAGYVHGCDDGGGQIVGAKCIPSLSRSVTGTEQIVALTPFSDVGYVIGGTQFPQDFWNSGYDGGVSGAKFILPRWTFDTRHATSQIVSDSIWSAMTEGREIGMKGFVFDGNTVVPGTGKLHFGKDSMGTLTFETSDTPSEWKDFAKSPGYEWISKVQVLQADGLNQGLVIYQFLEN